MNLLAQGWSEADIPTNDPGVTSDDIRACPADASAILHAEKVCPVSA